MLYTSTSPAENYDRIRLFPSIEAALVLSRGGAVQPVALGLDVGMRRVVPLWTDPWLFDPTWTSPVQLHPDGSVTARGPIPKPLFLS